MRSDDVQIRDMRGPSQGHAAHANNTPAESSLQPKLWKGPMKGGDEGHMAVAQADQ